jgi:AAA ATPase domain
MTSASCGSSELHNEEGFTMAGELKGRSPFNPGQPVPPELFTGRQAEIDRILQRGAGQTALGKPTAFFVQGEYGIGKSSIALYVQKAAELKHKMIGLYAPLGGVKSLADLAAAILEATLRSGIYDPTWREQIQGWLGKYVGKQTIFGMSINFEALKLDSPKLASPTQILGFLQEVEKRNATARGGNGVFLILDEINGIASEPTFAHFLKSLIDLNALSAKPVALLLMLCGIEQRRKQLIECHPPTDRLFDVVDIHPMNAPEMTDFFTRAFESVEITVAPEAMALLTQASAGFPKIMHSVGDSVFWKTSNPSAS